MNLSNLTRAVRAQAALQAYIQAMSEVFENSNSEIAGLIADLLHLAIWNDEGEEPAESTLHLALLHFEAEQADPEEA